MPRLSRLPLSTVLLACILFLVNVSSVVGSNHNTLPRRRHQQLTNRLPARVFVEDEPVRQVRKRRSCRPGHITNTTSSRLVPESKTQTKATPTPTNGNGGGLSGLMPSNWPSRTQHGAAPTATLTSSADPFLEELSKAYNNANNGWFNKVHIGQMTYYAQGLGACGDTYNDSSFTAAISHFMYDGWPGAFANEENRNPVCGPFVSGRKIIDASGKFQVAVHGSSYVIVGGDGRLNCDPQAASQCHIPLTATVKHGGKSIQVKIVDRCEACQPGDIDLTPAAFSALEDMSAGRAPVEWFFNKY